MSTGTLQPPRAPRPTGLGAIFLVLFLDLVGFSIIFPLGAAMLRWYGEHDEGLLAWLLDLAQRLYPEAGPAQREALVELGCDLGQGHLLGRPAPAEHLPGMAAPDRLPAAGPAPTPQKTLSGS